MNTQQLAFAATLSLSTIQSTPSTRRSRCRLPWRAVRINANPRRSPLPSVREIDGVLERKYGAPRYREITTE